MPCRFNRRHGALLPLATLLTALSAPAHAQQADAGATADYPSPMRLIGDIGLGVDNAPPVGRGQSHAVNAIPYANADYGRAFARIDTVGLRVLPAGYGYLELVGKFNEDGYTPLRTALGRFDQRKTSVPLGLGTLQVTPVGAFFVNVFRDVGRSKGNLADLIYAAEIDAGPLAIYPQAGLEYQSSAYTRYFYGVSGDEARRTGVAAYQPGAATNPFAALFIEAHVGGNWYVNANLRRTWLGGSVGASALVARHTADTGLVALSYRFK
ncbi:MipA/OmpV family protein [Rugamonas sp.]|uniref:MipA/OmpV family protein n=1 Tax=Rugamonas sp. TaxID=1926287 RepID=UPI0025FE1B98|nr:MipA/OmpV family protein [Rugamonas sp.]